MLSPRHRRKRLVAASTEIVTPAAPQVAVAAKPGTSAAFTYSSIRYPKVEVIERSGTGTSLPRDGDPMQEIPAKAIKPLTADAKP